LVGLVCKHRNVHVRIVFEARRRTSPIQATEMRLLARESAGVRHSCSTTYQRLDSL